MIHDHLFGEPADGGAPIDADVSLIAAYLARELSPVQMSAVKRRLATDPAFSATVGGIVDAWVAPLEVAPAAPVRALTSGDIARGWDRHVASVRAEMREPRAARQRSVLRAAAIVLAIALPALGIAQVVRSMLHDRAALRAVAPQVDASHPIGRDMRAAVAFGDSFTRAAVQLPAIRDLGPVVARSSEAFDSVGRLVAFSDGNVMVSDPAQRRIVLLDAELALRRTVASSLTGAAIPFKSRTLLLPFRGDSAVFYGELTFEAAVLLANGRKGRDLDLPGADAFAYLWHQTVRYGLVHSSPALGLIVRDRAFPVGGQTAGGPPRRRGSQVAPSRQYTGSILREVEGTGWYEDTVAVIASRYDMRRVDTLAYISSGTITASGASGYPALYPWYDEVVVTTDGSVAIFHAREFRVERIAPDGRRTPGVSLPYAWRRLAAEEKQRTADSASAKWSINSAPPIPRRASEAPEFAPPTGRNAVLADGQNNVWIRPLLTPGPTSGEVWWVVNRSGQLVDRVRIPEDRRLIGFGPNDVAFLRGKGVLEKAWVSVTALSPQPAQPVQPARLVQADSGFFAGITFDSATRQVVPRVNVELLRDSTPRRAGRVVSGDDGRVVIGPVPLGTYTVQSTRVGYRLYRTTVTIVAGATDTTCLPMPVNVITFDAIAAIAAASGRRVSDAPPPTIPQRRGGGGGGAAALDTTAPPRGAVAPANRPAPLSDSARKAMQTFTCK